MWLFLSFGFFSVVAHRDVPYLMLVRGRARQDLVAFRERLRQAGFSRNAFEIMFTPDADYPYRMEVSRDEVKAVLDHEIETVEATNFKSSIKDTQRVRLYHDVWATMYEGMEASR